jgi:alpha-galactosidase
MLRFSFQCAVLAAALYLGGVPAVSAADAPPIVASRGDAYIAHAPSSDLWTIGSRELALVIGFDAGRRLALQALSNPITTRIWDIAAGPDTSITLGSERVTLSNSGVMSFLGAAAEETDHGVRLTFTFEHRNQHVRIARVYACVPGSPTIETWTRIDTSNASGPVEVSDLVAWTMVMPVAHVKWLGGLRGDTADGQESGAFALTGRDLQRDERLEIGSDRRSSEDFVPFVLVDDDRDEFYGGIQWSGAWRVTFERRDDTLRVTAEFPDIATSVAQARPLELPHAFFGVTSRTTTDESGALLPFILNGIRQGRPFQPLVTYNTWFAYGTTLDEDTMVAAIDAVSGLGVENFVVDAGWYAGAGVNNDFDFDSGLGSWTVDPDRFPSSLASLVDYTHDHGMRFGLWVEPERVALSTVDKPGLAREAWLATRDGHYGSAVGAQLCLVREDARQWVLDKLVALIDSVRPDYLKWDNNFWINCNRPGHGHGPSDGNFAHVRALYDLLGEIRRRYPDMLIENVSGGGNRIDFGMLAYTDVAWMNDRTSPSTIVRHNIEGLTAAFPPEYLLSFVIDDDSESIHTPDDLALLVRSRLPAVFGMTFRVEEVDDNLAVELATEIRQYKAYRAMLGQSNATLLSEQAPVDERSWDVLQQLSQDAMACVLFAFKGDATDGRLLVRPRYLLPDAIYDVQSIDSGPLGSARGDLLMKDGVELIHHGGSRAHMIVLRAQ